MSDKNKKLQQALNGMLAAKLQTFIKKDLNKATCIQIYLSIFEAVSELVTMTPMLKSNLSEDAVNFVAQAYYDMVEIGNSELDPNIFDKRIYAPALSTKELTLVSVLFRDTPIVAEIVATIKKRN